MNPDQSFPKKVRLLKQADFDRVFNGQLYAADQTLVITAAPNGLDYIRLGLAVSRKTGNAVVRNQWKRRIREAFRLQRTLLPRGLDIVVRPRKGAECDFHSIKQSIDRLTARLSKKLEQP